MINYLAQYQANAILTSLALKNPFNYMLLLNNSLFFAKGTNRKCYFHPEDQNLCIKIPFQEKNKRQRRILRNIKRENNYYKKLSESTISWEHLSQYYGDVNTTLGEGSVYQIIRDSEGNIAKSLDEHLQQPKFIELNIHQLTLALQNLFIYMHDNHILTTSLLPRNIVLNSKSENFKLTIIDDIGNSEWLRISELTHSLMKKKVKRKWFKMLIQMKVNYPSLPDNFHEKILLSNLK